MNLYFTQSFHACFTEDTIVWHIAYLMSPKPIKIENRLYLRFQAMKQQLDQLTSLSYFIYISFWKSES